MVPWVCYSPLSFPLGFYRRTRDVTPRKGDRRLFHLSRKGSRYAENKPRWQRRADAWHKKLHDPGTIAKDAAKERANRVTRRTLELYPDEHIPCPLCRGHMQAGESKGKLRLLCKNQTCAGERPPTRIVRLALPCCQDCGRPKELIDRGPPAQFRCLCRSKGRVLNLGGPAFPATQNR